MHACMLIKEISMSANKQLARYYHFVNLTTKHVFLGTTKTGKIAIVATRAVRCKYYITLV